jgi:CRISPR-associated endonuclease/helicase Cas3
VETRLSRFSCKTPIDRARRDISDQCKAFAARGCGIYRLSVPTGAGKTLSSLRYALSHAAQYHKRHIIFVIPLLSVIEQNAAVIRGALGDDSLILEHHSNVVRDTTEDGELDERELLTENWSAPVILTTLVQLLNTLFLGKTSSIRRMNTLADSVLIFDEIQSLPRNLLSQFNLAINFLTEVCGATVVLCSATQPCLEVLPHPVHVATDADMVRLSDTSRAAFRRTAVIDRRISGGWSVDALADFARSCLTDAPSVLLICNTKAQALALYRTLSGGEFSVFHLSTAMCMVHRVNTLKEINAALKAKEPMICVSTQLVEAGIDFSFGTVIRILAGMDNAAQAAGRCNRSGEYPTVRPVYLVNLQGENLSRLAEIRDAQNACAELLLRYSRDASAFDGDLLSDRAVAFYYRQLFSGFALHTADCPLPKLDATMVDLLSRNHAFGERVAIYRENRYFLNQAFKTAGDAFSVFSNRTTDVLTPYHEGEALIAELSGEGVWHDAVRCKALLDRAKAYTVSLYDYQIYCLNDGGVYPLPDALALQPQFYDERAGVVIEPGSLDFMEV